MSPEVRYFEDFELDPSAYRLSRAGNVVRLERIPLELLFLLVDRRGQIVTREEILERIWGKGVFIDSENAINTAVRKVRRALDDDAESPRFIVTIPGKGYRFVAPVAVPNGDLKPVPVPNGEVTVNGKTALPLNGQSAVFPPAQPVSEERQHGRRRYGMAGLLAAVGLAIIAGTIVAVPHLSPRAPQPAVSKSSAELPPQLPDKPSIAVLPFTNLSADSEQEYFSDGITDELITDLSRLPHLFVIARSSSFAYKGKNEPVQQVGRQLGVNYLLEGSVRKLGGRLRIHVQLVDATGGNQVWAHRYDKQLGDVFAIQDEIVQSVVATLGVQFTALRKGIVIPQHTNNLEAYDYYLRGFEQLFITNSYLQAIEMFEKAVAADPGYSDAYVELALANQIEYFWQFAGDPDTPEKSETLARKAIELDESNADAYAILAVALAFENRPAEAIATARRAIALDGNNPYALITLSGIFNMVKQPEKALEFAQRTMVLMPNHPDNIFFEVGFAYNQMGRYREALEALKQSNPNIAWVHLGLIYSYMELGNQREAEMESHEVMRIAPNFSLKMQGRRWPGFFDDPAGQHYLDDLRRAGLK